MVYSDREKKLIRQFLKDLEALKNAHPNKRFNLTLGLQVSYEHMLDMADEKEADIRLDCEAPSQEQIDEMRDAYEEMQVDEAREEAR